MFLTFQDPHGTGQEYYICPPHPIWQERPASGSVCQGSTFGSSLLYGTISSPPAAELRLALSLVIFWNLPQEFQSITCLIIKMVLASVFEFGEKDITKHPIISASSNYSFTIFGIQYFPG